MIRMSTSIKYQEAKKEVQNVEIGSNRVVPVQVVHKLRRATSCDL